MFEVLFVIKLIISKNLGYLSESQLNELIVELNKNQKMIKSFKNSLKGSGLKSIFLTLIWLF